MQQLIFWASNGYTELHSKNIPNVSKCSIQEDYSKSRAFDFAWVGNEAIELPKQVYFVVKSMKNPDFEFYGYGLKFSIISKELLAFIQKHGYNTGYDYCPIAVVTAKGVRLTNKDYYLS
ncbi:MULTISPECIES: Imm43 family immunity protein [unclassified Acinetobacter]|uniref:Imm43 family immunity protein n=1 Tax=unclassified Acinetobacter TaxID=196816 RepID=UPI0035B97437